MLMKSDSREEGLFRQSGRQVLRQYILNSLKRGEKLQISNTPDSAKECAAALQLYLIQMKSSVIPKRVQLLLLADNPGITARTIARDALGLIRQEVTGRHSELLVDLLGLLKHMLIFPPPAELTELQAPTLAVIFLPIFFEMTCDDILKWRRIASRLNELIIEAPQQLLCRKKESDATVIEATTNETNTLARFRELTVFQPFIRLIENRNTDLIAETTRVFTRPLRRPTVGRLHPLIMRSR